LHYPRNALHIFATNRQKQLHNEQRLSELTNIVVIQACDTKDTNVSPRTFDLPDDIHKTGGLHEILRIAVGARVSITTNIDTCDGLVNGAQGTVAAIHMDQENPLGGSVMVTFDNCNVG
jgi:hypothetical protein